MKLKHLYAFMLLLITSHSLVANEQFTDHDFALLPPFCKARLGKTSAQDQELWSKRLGSGWIHTHHYCYALNALNHANSTLNKEEKIGLLTFAEEQILYVLEKVSTDFVLLPKLSYERGKIFEELGKTAEAIKSYQFSIKVNPKLPLPYAALSDLYLKLKNQDEALAILKKGLQYKPDSKSLKKRIAKLSKDTQQQ